MLVSVHMNAWTDSITLGTETYFPRTKPAFKNLDAYQVDSSYAYAIHNNMMSQAPLAFLGCNANRGVKKAGFKVIKLARVPGVLVEVCFLTNRCQQDHIAVQGSQALIANGIAAGSGRSCGRCRGRVADGRPAPRRRTHHAPAAEAALRRARKYG